MYVVMLLDSKALVQLFGLILLDQVVVLHSFNCVEYPIVFLALNRLGAIVSPSSPMFNADELADQIGLSKVPCESMRRFILLHLLTSFVQAVAIISHVELANTAIDAAGKVDSSLRVYTAGEGATLHSVPTMECVAHTAPPLLIAFANELLPSADS